MPAQTKIVKCLNGLTDNVDLGMALPVSQTAEWLAIAHIAEQVEQRPMVSLLNINRVASLANHVQSSHQQVRVPVDRGLILMITLFLF